MIKDNLELIYLKVKYIKSLGYILCNHFECERFNNDTACDLYSVTYMFSEYKNLLYIMLNEIEDVRKNLNKVMEEIYKEEK